MDNKFITKHIEINKLDINHYFCYTQELWAESGAHKKIYI